jgi:NitT/TauT family transport system substrate-binding protein
VDAIGGFTSTSLFNLLAVGVPREQIVLIPFASWGLDLYGNALVVRQDYAAKHPDMVRRFVRGTSAGTQALLRDPQAGMAAMKARDPLFDTALELQRWELVRDEAYLTPAVRQNGFGTVDPAGMQATITANAGAYGIAKPPLPTDIYTTAYLPPKEERIPAT